MSYDLSIVKHDGELDTTLAHELLGGDPVYDEIDWVRDGLTASILVLPEAIGLGISGNDAPADIRARDFDELLRALLHAAQRLGAELYDEQRGHTITTDDIRDVVRGFAGAYP